MTAKSRKCQKFCRFLTSSVVFYLRLETFDESFGKLPALGLGRQIAFQRALSLLLHESFLSMTQNMQKTETFEILSYYGIFA